MKAARDVLIAASIRAVSHAQKQLICFQSTIRTPLRAHDVTVSVLIFRSFGHFSVDGGWRFGRFGGSFWMFYGAKLYLFGFRSFFFTLPEFYELCWTLLDYLTEFAKNLHKNLLLLQFSRSFLKSSCIE